MERRGVPKYITVDGVTKSRFQWAAELGISSPALSHRVRLHGTEKAIRMGGRLPLGRRAVADEFAEVTPDNLPLRRPEGGCERCHLRGEHVCLGRAENYGHGRDNMEE